MLCGWWELSVGERTLGGVDALVGMELDGLVDTLESGSVRMTEDALTGRGLVVPPTVHMMSRYARPPYLGAVTTRGFYRGADAAEAVTRLGVLPAAAAALRLLVVWEHADLCASLDLAGWQEERYPRGLVVLDAHVDERLGHTVRWHPFELVGVDPSTRPDHRGLTAQGWAVVARWGSPVRYRGGWLPDPVAQLLAVWRAPGGAGDREAVARVRDELTSSGFVVLWKQP